jgi:hypothetical protein
MIETNEQFYKNGLHLNIAYVRATGAHHTIDLTFLFQ